MFADYARENLLHDKKDLAQPITYRVATKWWTTSIRGWSTCLFFSLSFPSVPDFTAKMYINTDGNRKCGRLCLKKKTSWSTEASYFTLWHFPSALSRFAIIKTSKQWRANTGLIFISSKVSSICPSCLPSASLPVYTRISVSLFGLISPWEFNLLARLYLRSVMRERNILVQTFCWQLLVIPYDTIYLLRTALFSIFYRWIVRCSGPLAVFLSRQPFFFYVVPSLRTCIYSGEYN